MTGRGNLSTLLLTFFLFSAGTVWAQEGPDSATAKKDESAPEPKLEPPVLTKFVDAEYPSDALGKGISARVVMKVEIDAEGKVATVEILQPVGMGFDEAAAAAVRQFEFKPATLDGEPIPVRIEYVYNFKLEKKAVKKEPGQVLEGVIKEKGVGLPVIGAEVVLENTPFRTATDGKGLFQLRQVPPGKYTIIVTSSDYKRLDTEVEMVEGKTLELSLLLEPTFVDPYETVVVGKKHEAVVAKYSLEQRTLETVPGTFGDPVRVLETLPGVARAPFGVGLLIIRGAQPNESKVFINGVQVPLLYHFLGGPSVLNPNFLDRIEYYPGNFPTRYGSALGGVVEIASKQENVRVFRGELDINLLNVSAYLEGKFAEKNSFRIGARRSYIDLVILAALEAVGEAGTTVAPVYYDYQLEHDYQVNPNNRIETFLFGSYDSLKLITTGDQDSSGLNFDTNTSFVRAVFAWKHTGDDYSLVVRPYFGWDRFYANSGPISFSGNTYTLGARTELKWNTTDWLNVTTGFDGKTILSYFAGKVPSYLDYYYPGYLLIGGGVDRLELRRQELDAQDGTVGWYTDLEFRPFKWWSITPGIRLDYLRYSSRDNLAWDPRIVTQFYVTDWLTLKGGVGKFSQEPDFQSRIEEYGNPDLKPQWALQYSAGFELEMWDRITLDMTGFYVDRHNLVVNAEEQTSEGGDLTTVRAQNQGRGRSYGMEILLKHKPSEYFYGWISYTLSRTELSGYNALPTAGRPPVSPETWFLSPYDQTHILSLVASVRLGRGWETGLRLRFVTGNPTTPVVQGLFVADTSSYEGLSGKPFSSRVQSFFQLDLRVEKRWTFDSWTLSAYLDIQNVTNHANTEFVIYDYRYRDNWNVPGIPILPSFGVSGRF